MKHFNITLLQYLVLLLYSQAASCQSDRLIGVIDNTLVEVNPFSPDLRSITEIDLPTNTNLTRAICYHPIDCIFYTIHEGGSNPQLASFDFEGNYTILGEITYKDGDLSIAEAIAYNTNDSQLYISGSLDGFDFGSESIFTLNTSTLECTFVISIETQENRFDIDNMVFEGNNLYFNDSDPGPSITKFYKFDITTAGPSVNLNSILIANSDGTGDVTIKDGFLYYALSTFELQRFDINNPVTDNLGPTHTFNEYNGLGLRGLEYIKGYREFDYESDLGDNFSICSGDVTDLTFTTEGYDIVWSTGETSDTIQITEPGIYSVEVLLDECKIFTSNSLTVDNDQSIIIDENISICEGDTISYNGNQIFSDGIYEIEIASLNDCDTIINLAVSVSDVLTILQEYTICSGDEFMIDTIEINSAGIYTYTTESAISCDTLYLINVIEISETSENIEIQLCNSDTVIINSVPYSISGSYSQKLTNSSGCDSILLIEVANDIQTPNLIESSICEGLGILINGEQYQTPGNYVQSLTSSTGCDSILNIIITKNDIYIPNVFSPKIDGNDSFGPFIPCEIDFFEFYIYDRWGNMVFRTFEKDEFWNGNYGPNQGLEQGIYTYVLSYGNANSTSIKSGNVLMLL